MGLNVLSIVLSIKDRKYFQDHTSMITLISVFIPTLINYFGLIYNKRYLKVIDKYDNLNINEWRKNISRTLVILYVLLTFLLAIYLALKVRSQSL
jgi:hypothetical protein